MSGHSKWQNFEPPNLTAPTITILKKLNLAQFGHNSIHIEQ